MRSLSGKFLIGVGVTSVITTLLASVAAFFVYRDDLADRQVKHLTEYVDQRSVNVSRRFQSIADIHKEAARQLRARMDALPLARASALVDDYFPLQADGTRRSRPQDFDGHALPSGDRIAGLGAFMARGRDIPPDETIALAAAFSLVGRFGEGIASSYDNFYFATPGNRVLIYGPTRPDRLMFYRHDAPASLDFSREEMMTMVSPAANPEGRTRCTSLQRYLQDKEGRRLATACMTPFTWRGRYVGAFGYSLQLHDYLTSTVATDVTHARTLLLRPQGDVIAMTGLEVGQAPSPPALARLERELHVSRLFRAVKADGRETGVIKSPDGEQIVGFAKIDGPDWWLLITYPQAEVQASAMRTASWILLLGLVASLAQTALVVTLARRTIAEPLERLARSRHTDVPPADLLGRSDEIGLLGRALQAEHDKTQALLVSLEERVAERTAELERASSEKDRFLANMSHELRTPLNGVIAVSETLAGLQRSKRARDMAQLIVSSSRLLEHVLSDILDFSRLDAGRVALSEEPFELGLVLAHTAELHRAVAEGKRLELTCTVAPEAARVFQGDPVRLTQVVSNLLSNAVKFTERGRVSLEATAAEGRVRITVSDTGIGFDAATGERLFHRFEQADASIRRRFGGTGLGLTIARSLTTAMGGTLVARSAPGMGAVFTLELPLAPGAAGAAKGAAASEAEEEAPLAGVRVLLAEDHPTNQKVVQLIVEAAGAELTVVENGREALVAMDGGAFDVVLMDMQMPELDGLSATRLLREREAILRLPRTPVVMLTANAMPEHVEASLAAGADRHLAKPIRAGELLAVLQACLSAHAGARTSFAA